MPQATKGKQHSPSVVAFDSLVQHSFPNSVVLAASMVNTAVQSVIPVPTNFKIYRVSAVMTGAPAGTASINIVYGAGAEGAQGTPDNTEAGGVVTLAPTNASVFAADQPITMTANTTTQLNVPAPYFDVIYGAGGILTLRIATSAAGAGTLFVILLGKYVDTSPSFSKPYVVAFDATTIP